MFNFTTHLPQKSNSDRLWKRVTEDVFNSGSDAVFRTAKELKTMLKNVKMKYWKWVVNPDTRPTGILFVPHNL